jgi:hypothetical protein
MIVRFCGRGLFNESQFTSTRNIMRFGYFLALVFVLTATTSTFATEPNETFATSTVLSPGVLSAIDALAFSAAPIPDTVLGVRDQFGTIYATDDDSSPLGDGTASGLEFVPTNSGSIDFAISGHPDFDFDGSHSEAGNYRVYVDVYDFFGDLVDELSEDRTLQAGAVHNFSYSDFEWINGDYDVYIDNLIAAADVDFFTFTGLTPGAAFTATTGDPNNTNLDTYLGWFDATGAFLEANDDIDPDNDIRLSRLGGIVPAGGTLTFAVTGFGDEEFLGQHDIFGDYELLLDIGGTDLPGDFNSDDVVDSADYVTWRNGLGTTHTPGDYAIWRSHFGQSQGAGAGADISQAQAVPEPAGILIVILAVMALAARRHRLGSFQ